MTSVINVGRLVTIICANQNWIVAAVRDPSRILQYNAKTFEFAFEYRFLDNVEITDIKVRDDKMYAVWDGEILEWDMKSGEDGEMFDWGSKCLALHVPIDTLYQTMQISFMCSYHEDGKVVSWEDDVVVSRSVKDKIKGQGRALCSYGNTMYIASEAGFFEIDKTTRDVILLVEGHVKSVQQDDNRIWVKMGGSNIDWNMVLLDAKTMYLRFYRLPDDVFCPHDSFLFYKHRRNIKKVSLEGSKIRKYPLGDGDLTSISICGSGSSLLYAVGGEVHKVSTFIYEEDSQLQILPYLYKADMNGVYKDVEIASRSERCRNNNIYTLEPYTEWDDPFLIYLQNSKNEYEHAVCFTAEEFYNHIESDRDPVVENGYRYPSNLMSIYTASETEDNINGYSTKPTGQIIVKLPVNNIYVTYNSAKCLFKSHHRAWIAVDLYGKRRRIGNIYGHGGVSRNHGQVPGETIFKLVPMEKGAFNRIIFASEDEYPEFLIDHGKPLIDLMNNTNVDIAFVNMLIDHLVE